MLEKHIQLAHNILNLVPETGISSTKYLINLPEPKLSSQDVLTSIDIWKEFDLIEYTPLTIRHDQIRLKPKGFKIKNSVGGFIEFYKQEKFKQSKKDARDEAIKDFHYKDLDFKVHKLNPSQLQFYADTWKRHWWTFPVSLGAAVATLLRLLFK